MIIELISYISRLIQNFTFNEDIAFVDINIIRILISKGFVSEFTLKKRFLGLLRPYLRGEDHETGITRSWIMELV